MTLTLFCSSRGFGVLRIAHFYEEYNNGLTEEKYFENHRPIDYLAYMDSRGFYDYTWHKFRFDGWSDDL